MNRRNFLNLTIGGVAASAAVRTWPFRVFSFPSEIQRVYFDHYGMWGAKLALSRPVAAARIFGLKVPPNFEGEIPYGGIAARQSELFSALGAGDFYEALYGG